MLGRFPVVLIIVLLLIGGYAFSKQQGTKIILPQNEQKPTSSQAEKIAQTNDCSKKSTPSQTEGPYYKSGSPQRKNIAQGVEGERLTITGYVYDEDCKSLPNAWLDFWQADSKGEYDNSGYILRGHQYTNNDGLYKLETIVPKDYDSRPPHIHVKVRKEGGQILTSQLYFPNEAQNQTDNIFDQALVMQINEEQGKKIASFSFILDD